MPAVLIAVGRASVGAAIDTISQRSNLGRQLKVALLQDLELHGLLLGLGEAELLLAPLLWALELRQIVEETVSVRDQRHRDHRLVLSGPDVDVVAGKDLIVRVDQVQDLDEPCRVSRLLVRQPLDQGLQRPSVLVRVHVSAARDVYLVDKRFLRRRRQADRRRLDLLSAGTKDLASPDFLHEFQRAQRLLLGGELPPVA